MQVNLDNEYSEKHVNENVSIMCGIKLGMGKYIFIK